MADSARRADVAASAVVAYRHARDWGRKSKAADT
jgi:hypothetical protein